MTMEENNPDIQPAQDKKKIPFWGKLSSEQKRKAVMFGILGIMILGITASYHARKNPNETKAETKKADVHDIRLDSGMVQNSLNDVVLKNAGDRDKQYDALKKEVDDLKAGKADPNAPAGGQPFVVDKTNPAATASYPPSGYKRVLPNTTPNTKPGVTPAVAPAGTALASNSPVPPPPAPDKGLVEERIRRSTATAKLPNATASKRNEDPEMIGGIDSSPVDSKIDAKDGDGKKKTSDLAAKSGESVYLPPSFVQATLLSGVTAKTSAQAKTDTSPMLFRIKDLAILPNKVKANLKGCFVVAEGVGDLSDERVHVRLDTLSCVAKDGQSVITQAVKGWAEDNKDGKVGLAGQVVSKMGTTIARSALAGFVGGFGDAMSASTMTTALNANGVPTSIFNSNDAKTDTKAGVGQGVKGASDELKKFYLDLAKQAIPVIEVLPSKKVTLVFSEGVDLVIKEVNIKK
jgi:conjugal transfer pilus assembly protein TraB